MRAMAASEEKHQPELIARSDDINGDSNFTQGCIFSPDGLCILTCTASDNKLRLYNTPTIPPEQVQDQDQSITNEARGEGNSVDNGEKETSAPTTLTSNSLPTDVVAWQTILSASAGDSVRSYSWYPLMNSYVPSSCAFISANR